jgi:quercetin dioxygenase-like cupin family protein
MSSEGKYIQFDALQLAELGNGFFGKDLLAQEGIELTYVTGDKGAGHDAHVHDNLDEVLIFMEGAADFTLDGTPVDVKAGGMIYAPSGVAHGVNYTAKSKVLRIKLPK